MTLQQACAERSRSAQGSIRLRKSEICHFAIGDCRNRPFDGVYAERGRSAQGSIRLRKSEICYLIEKEPPRSLSIAEGRGDS